MITDRDITVRATADGLSPQSALVRDSMTGDVIYCFDHQDVKEAARLMQEKQVRRLLVVDRNRQIVGILSLSDIALDSHSGKLAGNILHDVSERPEK